MLGSFGLYWFTLLGCSSGPSWLVSFASTFARTSYGVLGFFLVLVVNIVGLVLLVLLGYSFLGSIFCATAFEAIAIAAATTSASASNE